MRILKGDYYIKNAKCHDSGDKIRIIFDWPIGIQQVYIFIDELSDNGKLFTLQEYKKHGGFVTEKVHGETKYYIYPSTRKSGEDVLYEQNGDNFVCFIEKTTINCHIHSAIGKKYVNHEVSLSANYRVESDIICYVKKKNAPPMDITDGTLYYLSEAIEPGDVLTRIIRTAQNEYLRFFVIDNEKRNIYGIVQT